MKSSQGWVAENTFLKLTQECSHKVIHIFIHIIYILCEYCVNKCYNTLMKKLTEIKIRISEQDKELFRVSCGVKGMSKVLQDFIKLYSKEQINGK